MNGRRADGPAPATVDPQRGPHAPPNLLLIRSVERVSCLDRRGRRSRCGRRLGAGVGPAGWGRLDAPEDRVDGRRSADRFAGNSAGWAGGPGGECWRQDGCGDAGTRRPAGECGGFHPGAGPGGGGPADERRRVGRRWCGACRSRRGHRRLPAVRPTGLREMPAGRWPARSPLQWPLRAGDLPGPLPGASGSVRLLRDPLAIVAWAGCEAGRTLRFRVDARRPSPFRSAWHGG